MSGVIFSLAGCDDAPIRPRVLSDIKVNCEGGGNTLGGIRARCEGSITIGTTFKSASIGSVDFFRLLQGKFDLSRSNVVITSAGTSALLTATTAFGSTQMITAVIAQGKSARFANSLADANWLASINAASPVVSIDAKLVGIEYMKKDGVNALTIDVVADDGGVTVSSGTYNAYIPPGTFTPTPIHNQ